MSRLVRPAGPVSLAELADDVLLEPRFVARVLGVSERQVGRLADLPVVVISPRVHRVQAGDLRAWIAAHVRSGRAA